MRWEAKSFYWIKNKEQGRGKQKISDCLGLRSPPCLEIKYGAQCGLDVWGLADCISCVSGQVKCTGTRKLSKFQFTLLTCTEDKSSSTLGLVSSSPSTLLVLDYLQFLSSTVLFITLFGVLTVPQAQNVLLPYCLCRERKSFP